MSVIYHLHPWMSSMDEVSPSMGDIHRWYFCPWMTFLHPWMTSTNNTFIHGWDLLIHGLNCRPSDFAHVSQSFDAILATINNLGEQNVMDDNSAHGWTKLNHPWMENPHHGWYPWMNMRDDVHGLNQASKISVEFWPSSHLVSIPLDWHWGSYQSMEQNSSSKSHQKILKSLFSHDMNRNLTIWSS